jgi:HlyD family secretion protein
MSMERAKVAAPQTASTMLPQKKHRGAIAWITSSGAIGLAGLGIWWTYQTYFNHPPKTVSVTLVPVERGTVEVTVTESGSMELGGQQTLKAPREVTVEQVNVREGQRVQKGQPLVMLRDREVQDSLRDQEVENKKFGLDFARSREKVAEVQLQVTTAEKRLKESQELLSRGFISETELQTDQEKLDQLQSQLRDAQVEQQKAQLDVVKGQEKLNGLQQQFGDRVVVAPINGIVMKLEVKSGDGVKTETNLLTLGDPTQELVKLQLTTLNAAKVRMNQITRVSTIGPDAKTFTGRVISLSPQATSPEGSGGFRGGDDGSQAKVDAKVVLDRPSNTLIPGSLVSVEIITEQRQNVVAIPPEIVQRDEEKPFVWLKDSQGKAKKQTVTLGLQGLQQVEITAGLNTGDKLVMALPTTPLEAGAVLKIGQ